MILMHIPISLFRGDSVFTSFRTIDGAIPGLDMHLERLFYAINKTYLNQRLSYHQFLSFFSQLTKLSNQAKDNPNHYFRITIYPQSSTHALGILDLSMDISIQELPLSNESKRLCLKPTPYTKEYSCLKSGSYFQEFHAKRLASQSGFDDVIYYRDDFITEATTSSLLLRKNDFYILVEEEGNLDSITARLFEMYCQSLGHKFERKRVAKKNLSQYESVYLLNSVSLITPVRRIENRQFVVDRNLLLEFIAYLKDLK